MGLTQVYLSGAIKVPLLDDLYAPQHLLLCLLPSFLPPHQTTLLQLPQPTSKLPKQQPKRSSLQSPQPTPLYIIKTATLCSAANNI